MYRTPIRSVALICCLVNVGCEKLAGTESVAGPRPPPSDASRPDALPSDAHQEAGPCRISILPNGGEAGEAGGDASADAASTGDASAGNSASDASDSGDAADGSKISSAIGPLSPGDVVCFAKGRYDFSEPLVIDAKNVTLRGEAGAILDFSGERSGNAILVQADGATIDTLAIEDPKGNGVSGKSVNGAVIRNTRIEWSGAPGVAHGVYGVSFEAASHVLVEGSFVSGASDTGIRIDESETVVIRDDEVENSVAGIGVVNSTDVEVNDNRSHDNAAGILVLNQPGLPVENGVRVNVHDNTVQSNNLKNWAAADSAVHEVPSGTGIYVIAADDNEIHGNMVLDNQTYGIAVVSFFLAFEPAAAAADPLFDQYPEGNSVHDNSASGNGASPKGNAQNISFATLTPAFPDILWDGIVDWAKIYGDAAAPMSTADGGLPVHDIPVTLRNCFENNGTASFLDMDLSDVGRHKSADLAPFACTHPALAPIRL